ncbi:cell division protein ZipA C-terminal FtsZ-binding domain-containing protein [Rhodoferax sp. UBA5149]|uniref:cell division protein ZipA C-terminal FtsZ-binding domain-containing protein n=1 Tax=Rhodoferax sp. UBA5149 TaxID=1947379 RepID=UPI0025D0E3C0|nr:cell division protein ZipA C-terminal FtsZ-binding domain-containing protein [Rhodoferax sp. UBA5149]
MSSLQIGLAIVGVLVLAAVMAHGAWTTRKNLPRQATPVDPNAESPAGGGIEPELDAAAFDMASFPLAALEKKPAMDALIDVIAPITLDGLVSGDAALAAMPSTRRAGGKPFSIEGLNEASQRWEMPQAGQRYVTFQAGVQLANRSGALNDIEYSEFVMKTQAFCDTLNGTPDFPEMREEVARARELDQFAGDHDAQLGFVLRASHAAWSPGYVQQNATRLGFVTGAIAGRMVIPATVAGLPPVLSLSFDTQAALADDPALSAIRELVISLDVPQVDRNERAFARMREVALALADSMDGVVTDDNGQPLPSETMDGIGAELEHLYDTLDQRDLSAGSALARRLFS